MEDRCGRLSSGGALMKFLPFRQGFDDKRELGLGLLIAKRSIEADGGRLTVQDLPGTGCVFAMALPVRRLLA